MAIIKCPNCNKDISDKATECVHCGHVFENITKRTCGECGADINESDNICNNCGFPIKENVELQKVELSSVNIDNAISNNKVKKVLIILIIIIVVILSVKWFNNFKSKKLEDIANSRYETNLDMILFEILDGSVSAETCGNKIKKVWYNSIWEDDDEETDKYTKTNGKFNDDFNDSLKALFRDPDFISIVNDVEKSQKNVNKTMKELVNPPEKWKNAYIDLKELYDDYLTLTNLCINPSGNIQSYSSNFNTADSDTAKGYTRVKAYLD